MIIRDTDDSLMIVIISYDTDKARQKYRRNFFMAIREWAKFTGTCTGKPDGGGGQGFFGSAFGEARTY